MTPEEIEALKATVAALEAEVIKLRQSGWTWADVDWRTLGRKVVYAVVVVAAGYFAKDQYLGPLFRAVQDAAAHAKAAKDNSEDAVAQASLAASHAKDAKAEAAKATAEAQTTAAAAAQAVTEVGIKVDAASAKVDATATKIDAAKVAADAAKAAADAAKVEASKPKPLLPLNIPKE